jgi:chromosome partitioning protein
MTVIVVANPTGGVGKSTFATNLAGGLAQRGHAVLLGDLDRQQSSAQWLALRPPHLPTIQAWRVDRDNLERPPKGTSHAVLDTPASLYGKRLDAVLRVADKVLVPLQPSLFDIQAIHAFLQEVLAHRRAGKLELAVIGMRVKDHTNAAEQLRQFLDTLEVPVIGQLRDTQNYVQLAAHGLTVWDVAPSRVERDLPQWPDILDWAEA